MEALQKEIENESVLIAKVVIAELYQGFDRVMTLAGGLLYNVGKRAGKALYKHVKQKGLLEGIDPLEALLFTVVKSGYAKKMEVVERSDKRIVIRAEGMLIGSSVKKKKPVDTPVAGFIAGWLEEALGRKVDAKETKCVAKGDPYCEIEVKIK